MQRCATVAGLLALFVPGVVLAQAPGDVVFTELMIEARSDRGEWIELHAPGAEDVDLAGCFLRQIADGGGEATLLDGLVVEAGGYAVLSRQDPCVLYDADGVCTLAADFIYDSVSLNNSGGELLIECGVTEIDAVEHDWAEVAQDCRTANAVCSVNLSPDVFGDGPAMASANDLWADWCVPPARNFGFDAIGLESISTARATNACPEAGAVCGPGDAAFTEFMIKAPNREREWFELLVTAPQGCDLQGCRLQEGPDADPFLGPTESHWDFHTIDAPGNVLEIGQGQYAVFAKGDLEVGTETGGGSTATAANLYSGITFGDTDSGWLHLLCGGEVVDSAPYDWSVFEDSCPEGGCSVGVVPIYETAGANDLLGRWCLPPQEPAWETPESLAFRGTPGLPGLCDVRNWPVEGEVVFSEIMVAPAGGYPEWFEIVDRTGEGFELSSCRVERFRLAEDGTVDVGATVDYTLGADDTEPVLEGGGTVVFSKGCVNGQVVEEGGECSHDEYFFSGSLSFGNSEAEFLDLYCPDGVGGEVLVDRAGYDVTSIGARSGHSIQFDMRSAAPDDNDVPSGWCEASFDDPYAEEGGRSLNYGTPGVNTPCRTGEVAPVPSGPGCQCSSALTEPWAVSWLALLLIPVAGRRRRRYEA